jgi:hypothetical protein
MNNSTPPEQKECKRCGENHEERDLINGAVDELLTPPVEAVSKCCKATAIELNGNELGMVKGVIKKGKMRYYKCAECNLGCGVYGDERDINTSLEAVESLGSQIDRLANFIMREIDGEPSRSEGAVDCAIRLLRDRQTEITKARIEELEFINWHESEPSDNVDFGGVSVVTAKRIEDRIAQLKLMGTPAQFKGGGDV